MFLGLSVILVLFALAQAALDVASPVIFLRLTQTVPDGSPEQAVLYHTYLRLFLTRAALTAVNKYVVPDISQTSIHSIFMGSAIADCLFVSIVTIFSPGATCQLISSCIAVLPSGGLPPTTEL